MRYCVFIARSEQQAFFCILVCTCGLVKCHQSRPSAIPIVDESRELILCSKMSPYLFQWKLGPRSTCTRVLFWPSELRVCALAISPGWLPAPCTCKWHENDSLIRLFETFHIALDPMDQIYSCVTWLCSSLNPPSPKSETVFEERRHCSWSKQICSIHTYFTKF